MGLRFANIFEARLEAISTELNSKSELEWEIVEGVFTIKALDNIEEEYAKLTPKQIKLIEETSATKYANLLKAGEISEKMYAFYQFDKLTETEKDALKAEGFTAMLTPVLAVKLSHQVGQLQVLLSEICKAGINIEYTYALATGNDDASIVIKPADLEKAATVLEETGVELIRAAELEK